MIEVGLLGRRQDRVVPRAKSGAQVGRDVQIMKVAHVHVEEGVMLPNAIENIAGAAGAGTRGERDGERGAAFRKGAKFSALHPVQSPVDFQSIMIVRVGPEFGETEG